MKMPVLIVLNIITPVMESCLLSRYASLCDFSGFASAAVPVLLFPSVTTVLDSSLFQSGEDTHWLTCFQL